MSEQVEMKDENHAHKCLKEDNAVSECAANESQCDQLNEQEREMQRDDCHAAQLYLQTHSPVSPAHSTASASCAIRNDLSILCLSSSLQTIHIAHLSHAVQSIMQCSPKCSAVESFVLTE